MRNSNWMTGTLLALVLVSSNIVVSGHVSSHSLTDKGFCSLCVHPGGPDSSIVSEPVTLGYVLPVFTGIRYHATTHIETVVLHDHQSRAPPGIS